MIKQKMMVKIERIRPPTEKYLNMQYNEHAMPKTPATIATNCMISPREKPINLSLFRFETVKMVQFFNMLKKLSNS